VSKNGKTQQVEDGLEGKGLALLKIRHFLDRVSLRPTFIPRLAMSGVLSPGIKV